MEGSSYEVYAIRYAHDDRRMARENFLPPDAHDGPMPMDFFVWILVGQAGIFAFDTGFDEQMAKKRGRTMVVPIAESLRNIGIAPDQVKDVVLSHLHWDHAGNHDLFPNATYHVQEKEVHFCTGRCMCHPSLRAPYELIDVTALIRRVYEGRVKFHDGSRELAPGLSVHWVGGHSMGLQVLRVLTRRGWMVLASDAAHYYANLDETRPFPLIYNLHEMLDGFETIRRLGETPEHYIPGHDPQVLTRFPQEKEGLVDIVRVDGDPIS